MKTTNKNLMTLEEFKEKNYGKLGTTDKYSRCRLGAIRKLQILLIYRPTCASLTWLYSGISVKENVVTQCNQINTPSLIKTG